VADTQALFLLRKKRASLDKAIRALEKLQQMSLGLVAETPGLKSFQERGNRVYMCVDPNRQAEPESTSGDD
jgi:hypothetical protein